MKLIKRFSAVLLSLLMILSLCACNTFNKKELKSSGEKKEKSSAAQNGNKTITKEEYEALKKSKGKTTKSGQSTVNSPKAVKNPAPSNDSEEEIEEKDPITKISSAADLIKFSNTVYEGHNYNGVTVTLEKDINLAGVNFIPIGSSNTSFQGVFNGKNHTISNLTINSLDGITTGFNDNMTSVGLFGATLNAKISDLKLDNISINVSGEYNTTLVVGGLVGYFSSTGTATLKNIKATGKIIAKSSNNTMWNGGIVGNLDIGSNQTICKNLLSSVNLESDCGTIYTGGIMGSLYADAADAVSLSDFIYKGSILQVDSIYADIGGVCGFIKSDSNLSIRNCFVNCKINSKGEEFNNRHALVGGESTIYSSLKILNSFGYCNSSSEIVNTNFVLGTFDTVNCNFGGIPKNFKFGDQWNLTNRDNPDFNF